MKTAITTAIVGLIALGLMLVGYVVADQSNPFSPWGDFRAIVLNVAFAAIVLIPIVLASVWGVLALARFRNERKPDQVGRLPLLLDQRDSYQAAAIAALAATIEVERQRASIQPVPHTLHITHNPHNAPRLSVERTTSELASQPVLSDMQALDTSAPTFGQLLDRGAIGRGQPLCMGFEIETGQPLLGSWLDLFSVGIGGLSGSGKTTTGLFLAAQAALHGAQIAVLDPHAGDADSFVQRGADLAGAYLCQPATDRGAMLSLIALFSNEIEKRKGRGRGQPWLLVADEFTSLMRDETIAAPLADLLESISQEGRKLGVFALVLGQAWQAGRSGGGALRDSLASCYIHRLRPAQARMLSGLTADSLPGDVLDLRPGEAYLLSTRGELKHVTIPQLGGPDLARVAGLLTDSAPTVERLTPTPAASASAVEADHKPERSQKVAGAGPATSAPQSAISQSPEAARVLALFRDGLDLPAIVEQVMGVKSNQGARYQKAAKEVNELLRQAVS